LILDGVTGWSHLATTSHILWPATLSRAHVTHCQALKRSRPRAGTVILILGHCESSYRSGVTSVSLISVSLWQAKIY